VLLCLTVGHFLRRDSNLTDELRCLIWDFNYFIQQSLMFFAVDQLVVFSVLRQLPDRNLT
jgi:hypothetical protein